MGGAYRCNYTRKSFRTLYNNLFGPKRVELSGHTVFCGSRGHTWFFADLHSNSACSNPSSSPHSPTHLPILLQWLSVWSIISSLHTSGPQPSTWAFPILCPQLSSSCDPLSLFSSMHPTAGTTLILPNEEPDGAFLAHKLPRLPSAWGITVKLMIEASKALPHYPHPVVGDHVPLSEQTLLMCQPRLPTSKPHVYLMPSSCVRPPMKTSSRPTQSPIALCLRFCGWTSLVLPGVGIPCLHVSLLTWPGLTEAEERKIDFNRKKSTLYY